MKVQVRGYRGRGFGSWFIKWFTFSLGGYSHVSLIFDDNEEIDSLQGKGVTSHVPAKGDFDTFDVPLTAWQAEEAHRVASPLCGSLYDWRGIWGFMIRKKRHNEYRWFCSELVAYVLWEAGYKLSRREPYQETPTSVCESLRLEMVSRQGHA